MNSYILKNLNEALETYQNIKEDPKIEDIITDVSNICCYALSKGKKILMAGNGGSACDAQHFAAELVGRFKLERRGLSAISLSDNNSAITAIANDYEYKYIYSRQIEAIGNEGDVFVAFSTSGNSENIVHAITTANKKGIKVVGLTGKYGGEINEFCDILIKVPNTETARIQEGHILIVHIICGLIENYICK